MGDPRLMDALGLEIPSARLLQKVGGIVVDPAPLRPQPNVQVLGPADQGPQGAAVEATEAGADGGRGSNGPEDQPSHEAEEN